jgi:hypothetical protein
MAPPASVRLAPLLVPSPVWRLVWLMVRSTRFLDFGTRFYPILGCVCYLNYYFAVKRGLNPYQQEPKPHQET